MITPKDILKRVSEVSDTRLTETADMLLDLLRRQHRHISWKKECDCAMCQSILGEYVNAKLALRHAKKRFERFDDFEYDSYVSFSSELNESRRENNLKAQVIYAVERLQREKLRQKRLASDVL